MRPNLTHVPQLTAYPFYTMPAFWHSPCKRNVSRSHVGGTALPAMTVEWEKMLLQISREDRSSLALAQLAIDVTGGVLTATAQSVRTVTGLHSVRKSVSAEARHPRARLRRSHAFVSGRVRRGSTFVHSTTPALCLAQGLAPCKRGRSGEQDTCCRCPSI